MRWIDVKKRMPTEREEIVGIKASDKVWVAYAKENVIDCFFYGVANTVCGLWFGVEGKVLYWMPIQRVDKPFLNPFL